MSIRAATETRSLGRYHVVKRLAKGGMADVLLARSIGVAGFERHVVIKRIHPELGDDPRYRKMFLDEARLAASLHHHNIVQVNDIGEQAGEYFFAMEYVHGEDVRTLLMDANKRSRQIPIEHVITIVMAAAAGLHHAHEQIGPDKRPLHIVHRDVSPANILVGYDGGVKVADFGIAFAANRAEHTQSGVLKGKASYMSPEQCNCEPVDRRSDVFSLGIVLYELTTVHPCFKGDNDFHTMSAIVNGRFEKPSKLNPALHPELEAIIMKALAANRDDRFATCDEMRIALDKFADAQNLRTSTTALADYMKQQFGTRPEPWLEEATPDEAEIEITGSSPLDLVLELKLPEIEDEDDLSIPIEMPQGMEPIKVEGADAAADERARRETAPQSPRAGENPRPETAAESPRPLKSIPASTTAVRTSGPTPSGSAPIGNIARTAGAPRPTPSGSWNRLLATKSGPHASAPSNTNTAAAERPVKSTLPLRALKIVPPASPVPTVAPAVAFPEDDEPEVARSLSFVPEPVMRRLMMIRRAWLVASAVLLAIALVLFIIVMSKSSAATANAPAATSSEDVEPRVIETQRASPVVAPAPPKSAPVAAPPPAAAPKQPAKKAPTKKWDPDALFPN